MGHRIVVIGPDKPIYNEATATGAISPGMIVDRQAGNVAPNAVVNATGPVSHPVDVAVENDIFGGGINDDYAVGDTVISQVLRSGCQFYGKVAAGAAAIADGDYVTTAAGGFVAAGTQANAIGIAREAVNNSAGGSPAFILVEVL